jgi:hypothetical protein
MAIAELRLRKKELSLAKREVDLRARAVRAAYTDNVRRRGSKVQGGKELGRFIRTVQTILRDSKRHGLAQELEPLEREKLRLGALGIAIDQVLLTLQGRP